MDVHQQPNEERYESGSCKHMTPNDVQGEICEKDQRQSLGGGQPIRNVWMDLGMGMMRLVDAS